MEHDSVRRPKQNDHNNSNYEYDYVYNCNNHYYSCLYLRAYVAPGFAVPTLPKYITTTTTLTIRNHSCNTFSGPYRMLPPVQVPIRSSTVPRHWFQKSATAPTPRLTAQSHRLTRQASCRWSLPSMLPPKHPRLTLQASCLTRQAPTAYGVSLP